MSKREFVKAWNLEIGDKILRRIEGKDGRPGIISGDRVVDIVRHTREGSNPGHVGMWRSNVVLIGVYGAYSPKWRTYQGDDTVEIEPRS
jgi:hypothetical protein